MKVDQAGETWKQLAREVCVSDKTIQQEKPSPRKDVDTNETSNDSDYDDGDYDDGSEEDDSEEKEDETVKDNDEENVDDEAGILKDSVNTIKSFSDNIFGRKFLTICIF